MKKLSYVVLISAFCISVMIAQDGEPEGNPVEDTEKLEEQRTQLEEQKKQLEEEQLAAQQRGDTQTVQNIQQKEQAVVQQITIVEQELASVPKIGDGTTGGTGQEGGPITVTTTVTEQQILAATDLADWQKEFNTFSERPGRIWGRGGPLFTDVTPEQRADRLIDIIQKTPTENFTTFDGVEALTNIATLANNMRSGNYFTSGESTRDYNRVMDALTNKLETVIKSVTFPPERSVALEFDSHRKLMELIEEMPGAYKTTLEKVVLQKISDHLGSLVDSGRVGDTPQAVLDALSGGSLEQAITTAFDPHFFPKEVSQAVTTMLSKKMIDYFTKTDLNNQTPQAFNNLANTILSRVTPALKAEAESSVAKKLSDYLANTPLSDNPTEAFSAIATRYTDSTTGLSLSQSDLQKSQEGVSKAIDNLAQKALSLPPQEAFSSLVAMTQDKAGQKLFEQLPGSAQALLATLDTAVVSTLNSHASTSTLSSAAANAQKSYVDSYSKQADQLKQYLDFSQKYRQGSKGIEAQTAAAQRITRLKDFAEAQQGLPANKQNQSDLRTLTSTIKKYLVKNAQITKSLAPEFSKAEDIQKADFALGALPALPEDMLANIDRNVTDILDRISKTQDPKELKDLYGKLEQAYADLESPPIKDTTLSYEDLIPASDKALLDSLSAKLTKALGDRKEAITANVEQLAKLKTQLEETLPQLQATTLDTIGELRTTLDEMSKSLDAMTEHALPEPMVILFERVDGQVKAWSNILETAENYKNFLNTEATADQVKQANISLMSTASALPDQLNYDEPIFTDRLEVMKSQQDALGQLTGLLREPKMSISGKDHDLIEVGQFIEQYSQDLDRVDKPILDQLIANKFAEEVTETVDGQEVQRYRTTDKGFYLASISVLCRQLEGRTQQFDAYRKNNPEGKQPDPKMYLNGRPIEIAEAYQLTSFIPEDQIRILRWVYRNNFVTERTLEDAAARVVDTSPFINPPPPEQFDARTTLQGISDVLAVQRAESTNKESADPHFEGVIEREAKIADLPPEEQAAAREQAGLTAMVENIAILYGFDDAVKITNATALEEFKTLYKEIKNVVNGGLVSLSLRWKTSIQKARLAGSAGAWYSILPAGILAFFTTKIAIGYGSPMLGGVVGTAVGGPIGAVLGTTIGSFGGGIFSDIGGIFSGLGTAASLYVLSEQLKPNPASREALRQQMIAAGYKPEELPQNTDVWNRAMKGMKKLVSTDLTKLVDNAVDYKKQVDDKVATADKARDQLYVLLGLEPNARAVEVEAAFKKMEQNLNERFFLNRWLAKRRITQAYRFMIDTRRDALQAQMVHNQILSRITITIMAKIAEKETSSVKQAFSKFSNALGSIWSFFGGTKQGDEKMTDEQIKELGQQLIDSYHNQVADMVALDKLIQDQAGTVNKASPWNDTTLTDAFRDVLNSHTKNLISTYQDNVDSILKSWGYQPIGTT